MYPYSFWWLHYNPVFVKAGDGLSSMFKRIVAKEVCI